jgi:hypothetical protein
MKGRVIFYSLIFFSAYIFGCRPVSKKVEENLAVTKDSLNSRTVKEGKLFSNAYGISKGYPSTKADSLKLDSLYSIVTIANLFLDSTRGLLDKLDPNELNYVSDNLLSSMGDSLYQKVHYSLTASASFAKGGKERKAIDSIYSVIFSQPDIQKWKQEYFGQTSVFGASMIIHGFGIEIYRAAQLSLEGYKLER